MRFVLANRHMSLVGGTETHLVTIGDQLLRLGHEVVIYSPELGPSADHAQRRGLDVVDDLRRLPDGCDVVFAQDGIVVYDLAERYPQARMVFRICGDVFDFQSPPQAEGIVDLVVVLSDRYARLAQACAITPPLLQLRVPVDVNRLVPVGGIRARPRRAVVLGNYPDRLEVVREAWGRHGVEVTQVGGGQQRYDISAALESADIVVGKSRAALDAMACGRAVYVYDTFGGDGWVTPATYVAMEADHFAGQATGRVIGVAELERDLGEYHRDMGMANRDLVVQHHSARDHVIELLAALPESPPQARPQTPFRELARLTALAWSWERLADASRHEQNLLHERVLLAEQTAAHSAAVARAEQAAAEAERAGCAEALARARDAAALEAELDAIRRSRVWRLADRYWHWRLRLTR